MFRSTTLKSGPLDRWIILGGYSDKKVSFRELVHDWIGAIDRGTKKLIVENLPGDIAVEYDADAVVNALQVLERYDLVFLDGNTWMPT